MRAVTRVNTEQASKSLMRKPTRFDNGEGHRRGEHAYSPLRRQAQAIGTHDSAGVRVTARLQRNTT